MVDAVQQKAFVIGMRRKIGFFKEACEQRESGLKVLASSFGAEHAAEAEQTLNGDGAGGGVDGFKIVEQICWLRLPVAETV